MFQGLMVVNAFLRTTKFDDLYRFLLQAAQKAGMALDVMTNAELCCRVDSPELDRYDFVLFWDKDVQLAMQLENRGMRLFNSAQSILLCDDKALTYLSLKKAGVAMPRTILAPKTFPGVGYSDFSFLQEAADVLGFPMVVKECFGSFGQQVYLAQNEQEALEIIQKAAGNPLLFQRFIQESAGTDLRLYMVGGKCVAAMRRRNDNDFRANIQIGGHGEIYPPTEEEIALAARACHALSLDFAGVDILHTKDGPVICEVNSNAHFTALAALTKTDVAGAIMQHIQEALCAAG